MNKIIILFLFLSLMVCNAQTGKKLLDLQMGETYSQQMSSFSTANMFVQNNQWVLISNSNASIK